MEAQENPIAKACPRHSCSSQLVWPSLSLTKKKVGSCSFLIIINIISINIIVNILSYFASKPLLRVILKATSDGGTNA